MFVTSLWAVPFKGLTANSTSSSLTPVNLVCSWKALWCKFHSAHLVYTN